jgi:hypothetical protein
MKLTNGGITVNVSELDANSYIRVGYWKIEEPVEISTPEVVQELPPEKAAKPVKVAAPVKKTKKVVKHGT